MSSSGLIRNDIVAVGLLALIVFLIASVGTYTPADPVASESGWLSQIYQADQVVYPQNESFSNACGRIGAWTSELLLSVLGVGAYFFIIGLIALEISVFRKEPVASPWVKTVGWVVTLFCLCSLASMLLPSGMVTPVIGPGGYLGALGRGLVASQVGVVGSLILFGALALTGMMMWTEYLVFRAGRFIFAPAMVAATTALPFGMVHQFMSWFNGGGLATDLEDELDLDEDEDAEAEDDLASRFSFRSPQAESVDDADAEYDEEEVEEELEGEDEEWEEEDLFADEDESELAPATTAINVRSQTKTPVPAIEPEPAEPVKSTAAIPKPHFRVKPAEKKPAPEPAPPSERELVMSQLNEASRVEAVTEYSLPSISILEKSESIDLEQQKQEAFRIAEVLEKTCKQFGHDVKVVDIEAGPVISQYEIDLAPGLRLSKIVNLADDLAVAMRVPSVRIVAPIPGKNSVGVEVPNETRQVVRMRAVMEQCRKQIAKMKIPLFLGSDAVGQPLVSDLAKLPHLLIAGRTGTGKSVCLNAIICSILMTRRPDEVRLLMIDPKMVEMSGYGNLPHLMHPVVTDMKKAEAILAWAVDKMEERYKLLARAGVRHVTTYNELGDEELIDRIKPANEEERQNIPSNMPFIVIIADEMADLMMTAGKEVEQHIIRLAQKSRAVGIHLILATQKPTVDVITGLIKSNLPARISFQVASKMDSRVVLDAMGADKLLGCGDMLFLWPGTSNLLRGQGTYLSDEEIDSITATVSTGEQNFVEELVNMKVKSADGEGDEDSSEGSSFTQRDELYQEAIDIVVREQRGSLSLLQRALGIGYGRAARLVDFMAEDGYVGPYNASKAREVLLTQAVWDNIKAGDANPVSDEDWVEEEPAEAAAESVEPVEEPAPEPAVVPRPLRALDKPTASRMSSLAASTTIVAERLDDAAAEEEEENEEEIEDNDDEYLDAISDDSDLRDSDAEEDFEDEDEEEEAGEEDDEEYEEEEDFDYEDGDYDEEEYEDVD